MNRIALADNHLLVLVDVDAFGRWLAVYFATA
jgi:hypothetical protein